VKGRAAAVLRQMSGKVDCSVVCPAEAAAGNETFGRVASYPAATVSGSST